MGAVNEKDSWFQTLLARQPQNKFKHNLSHVNWFIFHNWFPVIQN